MGEVLYGHYDDLVPDQGHTRYFRSLKTILHTSTIRALPTLINVARIYGHLAGIFISKPLSFTSINKYNICTSPRFAVCKYIQTQSLINAYSFNMLVEHSPFSTRHSTRCARSLSCYSHPFHPSCVHYHLIYTCKHVYMQARTHACTPRHYKIFLC